MGHYRTSAMRPYRRYSGSIVLAVDGARIGREEICGENFPLSLPVTRRYSAATGQRFEYGLKQNIAYFLISSSNRHACFTLEIAYLVNGMHFDETPRPNVCGKNLSSAGMGMGSQARLKVPESHAEQSMTVFPMPRIMGVSVISWSTSCPHCISMSVCLEWKCGHQISGHFLGG